MKIAIVIILVLILFLLLYLNYFGLFYKIKVSEKLEGGEIVAFEEIKGDYRQSKNVMDKVYYALLNDHKVETFLGYGTFYDNPQEVPKVDLRSEAGCIIPQNNEFVKLKDHFNIKQLSEEKYIVSNFPFKGQFSVFVSIMRVYPALKKYAQSKGFDMNTEVTEIYDIPNKKILYRMKIKE